MTHETTINANPPTRGLNLRLILILGSFAALGWLQPTVGAEDQSDQNNDSESHRASPVERPASNPALAKLNDAITFYLSFDRESPIAEMSEGQGAPQKGQVKIERQPGLMGKAFVSGTHRLTYAASNNADLSATGSMSAWVSPWQWEKKRVEPKYLSFIKIMDRGRLLTVNRMGNPVNKEQVYAYARGGGKKVVISAGKTLDWKQGQWHLLVVNWRPGSIEVSLDGQSLKRREAQWLTDVSGDPGRLLIGGKGHPHEQYLIDELIVLDRPMQMKEIQWLYEQGKQAQDGT